jgi:hypothetical protein
MRAVDRNLWVHEHRWEVFGLSAWLRMTIVKLADGRLWIHSPTALSAEVRGAIDSLGEVGYLVAANNHHHSWLLAWHDAYPRAQVFVSRGLPKKVVGLRAFSLLEEIPQPAFQSDLSQVFMRGAPFFSETVFLHRASASLIVTDLVQNYAGAKPEGWLAMLTAPLFAALGFKGQCLAPPLKWSIVRKDDAAFGAVLRAILAWEVSRIIVTHGDVIEQNAAATLAELFAPWLPAPA